MLFELCYVTSWLIKKCTCKYLYPKRAGGNIYARETAGWGEVGGEGKVSIFSRDDQSSLRGFAPKVDIDGRGGFSGRLG